MERYEIGSFVYSKAGHDKDEIYVILSIEENLLVLADGKLKTVEKPKKKNIKHVKWIGYKDEVLYNKLLNNEKIIDEDIKYAIKNYRKHQDNLEEM